jgi:hypothetical protein
MHEKKGKGERDREESAIKCLYATKQSDAMHHHTLFFMIMDTTITKTKSTTTP